MPVNTGLQAAKAARKNEFYTLRSDIERELCHYEEHFRGKSVLLNCDDPFDSAFFGYFRDNFRKLGLEYLSASCITKDGSGLAAIVTNVPEKIPATQELFQFPGNTLRVIPDGDFRSKDVIALLTAAHIVVTNPPFSLFREYMALLLEHRKKFIVMGNVNAVTQRELFPLLMKGEIPIGPSIRSGDRMFHVPDDYPLDVAGCGIDPATGRRWIRVKGVRWFTNLEPDTHEVPLVLQERWTKEAYPQYDNYNAIEVGSVRNIPGDWPGMIGVPVTFLDKWDPEQFEIIGADFQVKDGLLPFLVRSDSKGSLSGLFPHG